MYGDPNFAKALVFCVHTVWLDWLVRGFNSYTWSALSFLYYQNLYIWLAYAGKEFQSEFSIYKISPKNQ